MSELTIKGITYVDIDKDFALLIKERDTLRKQLDMAMEMMRGVSHLWHGRGLSPQVLIEIDKTIVEIENIDKEVSNE